MAYFLYLDQNLLCKICLSSSGTENSGLCSSSFWAEWNKIGYENSFELFYDELYVGVNILYVSLPLSRFVDSFDKETKKSTENIYDVGAQE